jgi:hypothetical protein
MRLRKEPTPQLDEAPSLSWDEPIDLAQSGSSDAYQMQGQG